MQSKSSTAAPGFRLGDSLTIVVAFFAVAMTVAVTLVERGTSTSVVLFGGLVCYAVTSQLAFIAVSDAGGSLIAGVASGWLVASRFGILSVALRGLFAVGRSERIALALFAVDPNVGFALQHDDLSSRRRVYWRITAALTFGSISGTVVGLLLGNIIGDTTRWGLDVMFPAALLAIIGNRYQQREGRWAALLGVAMFFAFLPWAPAGVPILVSAFGAVAVAVSRSRTVTTTTDEAQS